MKSKTKYLLKLLSSKRKGAQLAGAIILLISLFLLIRHLFNRSKINKIYNEKYDEIVKKLSSYEFEHYIANIFRKLGYKTKVTPPSNDFGVDIIAKKNKEIIAVQVKKYIGHPVGNREVQMLLGAMQQKKVKASKSILITTSYFTKSAILQSEGCPIELWDENKLKTIINNISSTRSD